MSTAQPTDSIVVVIARIFWMMFGPALLFLTTIAMVQTQGEWFTSADFAFLIFVQAIMLARWIEFRGGDPRTATGEPATPADFRRYILSVMAFGLGTWVVANLISRF